MDHNICQKLQGYSKPIKIDIVDDHKMIVQSLCRLIDSSKIAVVEHVYYDIKSCKQGLMKNIHPDILLLDIGLPDGDGVAYCAEIIRDYPDMKIIMLTSYNEFNVAKRALSNGALGYILKNAEPEEIFAGIETVNRGQQFLCEEIDILLSNRPDEEAPWFSNREMEILQYIANGCTTREIARKIYRDDDTVKSHRRNLLIKMDAVNTAVLIRKAYEQNLLNQ